MRNCPEEYFNNCNNALAKCRVCAAGKGRENGKVLYRPILTSPELKEHPHIYTPPPKPNKDKKRSKIVRKGYKAEAEAVKKIARLTIASGRVHHDGDLSHLEGELNLEHKLRKPNSNYSIRKAEYQKMKDQRLDGMAITVEGGETMYMLTENAYARLLALANHNKNKEDS